MANKPYVIGNHLYFAPEGAGSTQLVKPAVGAFVKIGECTQVTFNPQVGTSDVMQPSPVQLQRTDVLATRSVLDINFHVVTLGPEFWALLKNATGIVGQTGSVNYNPGSGTGNLKGWLKHEMFGQLSNVTPVDVADYWVSLELSGNVSVGGAPVEVDFMAKVILSAVNQGTVVLP